MHINTSTSEKSARILVIPQKKKREKEIHFIHVTDYLSIQQTDLSNSEAFLKKKLIVLNHFGFNL